MEVVITARFQVGPRARLRAGRELPALVWKALYGGSTEPPGEAAGLVLLEHTMAVRDDGDGVARREPGEPGQIIQLASAG
jgi:hypothetical protein